MDLIDIGINRGIQQGISQGISRGISRGISQGELKNLISLVSKKKAKNCSVAETADMLETDVSLVQKVYDALEHYDAEKQWKKIMKLIQ